MKYTATTDDGSTFEISNNENIHELQGHLKTSQPFFLHHGLERLIITQVERITIEKNLLTINLVVIPKLGGLQSCIDARTLVLTGQW